MTSQTAASNSSSSRADKYLIAEQVGKGSFGAANVVINKETKKKYVLKRIRLARLSEWQRNSSFQELQLVSSLDHPFVVPFVEGWVDRGHTINIVYGYCRNGDLGSLLHSHKGHFSEDRLKTWMAQALLGMEYIHHAGVLHRDIKSSNLFLTRDYDIQIGDFGLATIRDGKSGDPDYSVVGTPHYMSPELLSKQCYGFPSDVWSLGCVMYELTALKPAFNAFNMHGLIHKIRKASLAPLPSQYSSEWRTIIKSMLRKAPSKRPTISDLINAPCMREAVLKACKRAKQINQHFCYTDLMHEIPEYWKPQFSLCRTEQPFKDSEAHKDSDMHNGEQEHRVQEPLKSEETSCQDSEEHEEDMEPPLHESESPSSPKTDTEDSICDQASTSRLQIVEKREEKSEEMLVKNVGNMNQDSEIERNDAQADPCQKGPCTEEALSEDPKESVISEASEQEEDYSVSRRSSTPADPSMNSVDGTVFCSEDASSPQDTEQATRIKEERDTCGSSGSGGNKNLPYRVDVVDVKKLATEAEDESEESLYPSNHWCNPSHMSAFIDGKRFDGLEAIPEGSCEEAECIFWQSLPVPNMDVYSIASPGRENVHEFQNSLTSQPDPQASHSFWGDSPSQMETQFSSCAAGSLGVDGQKRLDTLEQVLALCSNLYNRGRWHELGHILTQTSKQCLTQGCETPDSSRTRLNLCTGDRVTVGSSKPFHSIVRYYGPVAFGPGDWVGLELDTASGNTDGTVNGIPYFSCPKDCGLFMKAQVFDKTEN